jgi:alpha-tubulin suppressor-like RCC1 family protein
MFPGALAAAAVIVAAAAVTAGLAPAPANAHPSLRELAVHQVAPGEGHTCARVGHRVLCWGRNERGQLGTGDRHPVTRPVIGVELPVRAAQVAAGQGHSCARLQDGTLWCWGANSHGQLGDGSEEDRFRPVRVVGLEDVVEVALGDGHTCARVSAARGAHTYCWGSNHLGQLGDGTRVNRSRPVRVVEPGTVEQLALGGYHSCARLAGGTVRCWGGSKEGRSTSVPTPVEGLKRVAEIAHGTHRVCARHEGFWQGGHVSCWDAGAHTARQPGGPSRHPGMSSADKLAMGGEHACVIERGAVRCWGANGWGQLGDGSLSGASSPVRVSGLRRARAVALGKEHSCALVGELLHCWGRNDDGQAGVVARVLRPGEVRF